MKETSIQDLGVAETEGVMARDLTTADTELYAAQTGVQGIIYAYSRNREFLEHMTSLLLFFGKFNSVELFT